MAPTERSDHPLPPFWSFALFLGALWWTKLRIVLCPPPSQDLSFPTWEVERFFYSWGWDVDITKKWMRRPSGGLENLLKEGRTPWLSHRQAGSCSPVSPRGAQGRALAVGQARSKCFTRTEAFNPLSRSFAQPSLLPPCPLFS